VVVSFFFNLLLVAGVGSCHPPYDFTISSRGWWLPSSLWSLSTYGYKLTMEYTPIICHFTYMHCSLENSMKYKSDHLLFGQLV
jgi:hypothetical protein